MIDLKYGTYIGDTLNWSSSQSYNELEFKDLTSTERVQGSTLSGNRFNHLLHSRNVWRLTISADELYQATKETFMRAFYKAQGWKWSDDNWSTETVVDLLESGDIPYEFINNHIDLKEITLTFIEVEPD